MTRLLTTNCSHSIVMIYYQPIKYDIVKRHICLRLKIQAHLRIAEASQVISVFFCQKPLRVPNQTIVSVSTQANFYVNILLVVMTLAYQTIQALTKPFNVQNYNITNQCSALSHSRFLLVFMYSHTNPDKIPFWIFASVLISFCEDKLTNEQLYK